MGAWDLRRALRPHLWMGTSELEPPADTSESALDWARGAYFQRASPPLF